MGRHLGYILSFLLIFNGMFLSFGEIIDNTDMTENADVLVESTESESADTASESTESESADTASESTESESADTASESTESESADTASESTESESADTASESTESESADTASESTESESADTASESTESESADTASESTESGSADPLSESESSESTSSQDTSDDDLSSKSITMAVASSTEKTDKISLNIDEIITGISKFDDQDMNGYDSSATNDILRTLDFLKFKVSYSVINELDTANNVKMKCTLSKGHNSGQTVAIWDKSLIDGNEDFSLEGDSLLIDLKNVNGGYAKKIDVMAQALSTAEDGETFSLKVELITDNLGTLNVDSRDITITSRPNADIFIKKSGVYEMKSGYEGKKGKIIYYAIGININGGVGSEILSDTIKFEADIKNIGIDNIVLFSEADRGTMVCAINGDKNAETVSILPYGKIYDEDKKESSVANSGSISAVQVSKGENIQFTINGLDSKGLHYPSKNAYGDSISIGDKAIFAGYFKVFVADEDLEIGQNKLIMNLINFQADGISGKVNTGDDISNNKDEFDITRYASTAGRGVLTGRIDYYKDISNTRIDTMTDYNSGDGTIVAGQRFVSHTSMSIGEIEDLTGVEILTKFDPSVAEVVDIEGDSKPYVFSLNHSSGVIENPANWLIDYGVKEYSDYSDMEQSDGSDAAWYGTLSEAKSAGQVLMLRARLIGDNYISSEYRPQFYVQFLSKKDSEVGDIAPVFLSFKAANSYDGRWQHRGYDPITNEYAAGGQKLTITKADVRVVKEEVNDIKSITISDLDSKQLDYRLNLTFTSDPRLTGTALIDGDIFVKDVIKSNTVKYIEASSNYPVTSVKKYDDRTEIIWKLESVRLNEAIEPITYSVDVLPDTIDTIDSIVVVESDLDGSVEAKRSSQWVIGVVNTNAWAIREEVITPRVEIDDSFGFEVYYSNFDTSELKNFTFVSVLPNEDNSNFKGSYKIKNLQGSNSEEFFITKEKFDQDSISSKTGWDNIINTVTWEKFDVNNPEHMQGIYAVRYDVPKLEGKSVGQKVTYTFEPSDNFEGDIYSNKTRGVTETIANVIVSSKLVSTEVIEGSIGQYLWIDENNDKLMNPEENGFVNIPVKLQKYDGASGLYSDIKSTVTDDRGHYVFEHLHSGKYKVLVDESKLAEYKLSKDPDGIADNIHEIDLKANEDYLNANFGYYKEKIIIVNKASIGDYIWIDSNKNGIKDGTEVGIKNNRITLDIFNTISGQFENYGVISTDDSGNYKFSDLGPGRYKVIVDTSNLSGYKLAKDPDGKADSIHEVELLKDQEYTLANFAYVKEESKSSTPSSSSSKKKKKTKKNNDSDDDYVREEEDEEELFEILEEEIPLGETTIEKGKIIIYHLEDETREILYPTEERFGAIDSKYETNYREFDGYRLVEVPENYKGSYDKKTKTIVYYYTRIDSEIVEKAVEVEKLPETGESGFDLSYYLGVLMIILGSITLICMRKNKSMQ